MKYILDNQKGYPLIKLSHDCEHDEFYNVANTLENKLGITFINKINDFDSLFWDFKYKLAALTLHYNAFLGLSIYPTSLKDYGIADEKAISEIRHVLSES